MPLFEGTQQQYYGSESFTATGGQTAFVLTFPDNETLLNNLATMPDTTGAFNVTINGTITTNFSFNATTNTITLGSGATNGDVVVVSIINPDLGNYQYISLQQFINNFKISYVGEGKIISKVKRADVLFHAQRGLQEFNYDILRSEKAIEIELPPSLKMALPHDYVNYVKVTHSGTDGIERPLYPAIKTSNPTAPLQASDFGYIFDSSGNVSVASDSDTWNSYLSSTATDVDTNIDDPDADFYLYNDGRRYGLDPQHAQKNGVFYIDHLKGNIHFSSDMSGKRIILKYVSDGIAVDEDAVIHKFAEEALYKWVAHAILSTRIGIPEYIIARYKKERFAAMRNAKIRLTNYKAEELTQIMRGKSKVIKH